MEAIVMFIFIILVAIVGFMYFELQDRREAKHKKEA